MMDGRLEGSFEEVVKKQKVILQGLTLCVVVVVRDVPATVCSQCGADWIEDRIASKLEEVVNDAKQKHLTVEVTTLSV